MGRVDITATTQVAIAPGHQERQLVAGRYRLGSFHRGDDSTEVWRALDQETNQVVSLEFLRDPNPASRERFVAGARRLQSAPPSVMRVSGIHDGAEGTFIVFEHLVHIPVPVGWLELQVAPATPPVATDAQTTQTSSVDQGATPPAIVIATSSEATTDAVASENAGDHGLSLLLYALRSRELSLIDKPLLQESLIEFLDVAVAELKAVRLDPDLLPDARAFVGSLLTSGPTRAAAAVGRLATIRPHVRVPTPRLSRPRQPKQAKAVSAPRLKQTAMAAAKPLKAPKFKAPRAVGTGTHVRWGRVLFRGLSLGVIAAFLVALPPGAIGNLGSVANDVANVAGNVASQVSSTIGEKLASTQSTDGLQRATFDLPPLSAYAATFEAQAPYPTAHPNGTVEWVVALRNTGSVGWYRGIDGAQASLALADGTTAGVQTTAFVGPGQVGWFVVHFPAPSQPGVTRVTFRPRIDGRGSLPDLGVYATVTVSPNP
jgi:hypothetical protein